MLPTGFKDLRVPRFYINGSVVTEVKQESYLGYTVSSDCCDDEAMMKELRGLYARGNMLIRNFRHCSTEVKVKLFTAYCNSFYCCSLWNALKTASFKRLIVGHNRVFRSLLNVRRPYSASHLFVIHGVPNMLVLRRKLVFSLYNRVLSCHNALVLNLVSSLYFNNSSLYKYWTSVLF